MKIVKFVLILVGFVFPLSLFAQDSTDSASPQTPAEEYADLMEIENIHLADQEASSDDLVELDEPPIEDVQINDSLELTDPVPE